MTEVLTGFRGFIRIVRIGAKACGLAGNDYRGTTGQREVGVRVMYEGEELSNQRLDMIVDGKVIVEIKSTLDLHNAARRQVYNYLKATNLEVGLLLHFGPKAAFYREVCNSPKKRSAESAESFLEPSVIDA